MMTSNTRPRWFFYPAWVASSAISIPIAGAIAWALVSLVEKVVGGTIQVGGHTRITEDYLSAYILLLVLGLLAGFLQYLLLRRHLPRMGWWIAATTLGLLLGLVGGRLLFRTLHSTRDSMWSGDSDDRGDWWVYGASPVVGAASACTSRRLVDSGQRTRLGCSRLGSSDPFQPNGSPCCGHTASTWYRHEHCLVVAARPVAATRGQLEEFAAQQVAGAGPLIENSTRCGRNFYTLQGLQSV